MKTLEWDELYQLQQALSDLIGYVSDNSCGDPDCCGGPYYTQLDAEEAKTTLAKYGIKWNERME